MAIKCVEFKEYRVFKNKFSLEFCKGVNVIIGENGTGKTTLLRTIYRDNEHDNRRDIALHRYTTKANVIKDDAKITETVFIPEKDMLSHSKGLLPLWNDRNLPYMKHEIDILSKAQMPETRELKPNAEKLIGMIKEIIGGEVLYEDDEFYTIKKNGEKVLFCVEASGFRKFGLLWKLLRNGLLEQGTVLLWDEPENSLNPELIPKLVDILLELSRNGIQIFIATHSEILSSYFAVNRHGSDNVMFYSLYKDGEGIKANSSDRFDLLRPNNLTAEPVKLYEKEIEKGLSSND